MFFFFKQKTAYEMRISDWSSDVCSSDLRRQRPTRNSRASRTDRGFQTHARRPWRGRAAPLRHSRNDRDTTARPPPSGPRASAPGRRTRRRPTPGAPVHHRPAPRSEEHTSELTSLIRISYAIICLKKKKKQESKHNDI